MEKHERGVIHRNLKFESIIFEHSGANADIRVTDFGVSRRVQTVKGSRLQDSSGMGTM